MTSAMGASGAQPELSAVSETQLSVWPGRADQCLSGAAVSLPNLLPIGHTLYSIHTRLYKKQASKLIIFQYILPVLTRTIEAGVKSVGP